MKKYYLLLSLLLLTYATANCKAAPASYRSVIIKDVPHVLQQTDFCGEACVEMVLRKLGKTGDQNWVWNQSGLDPVQARGCYTAELKYALQIIGFNVGKVFSTIRVAKQQTDMDAQWKALHADLLKGVPSIICTRYNGQPNTTEHFRLVLGFDAETDEVIYHEPAEPNGAYRRMKRARFISLWPLKYASDQWTVIRFRLAADQLKEGPSRTSGLTEADYAQHIMKLKQKLPGPDFSIVMAHPFVVVGDEAKTMVMRRASNTVGWAVRMLKKSYFQKDPNHIIDVWLFRDKASYMRNTQKLFNDTPHTPYGYYSERHKALIMNIATGGGTLVHEIVHPFMAINFPDCPAWFNEGLASLYEQSMEKNQKIHGSTNWRLAGLQEAVRANTVPDFKTLTHTTTNQFYNYDPGTNYSQARYLCYYLQQHGLLEKYYKQFAANYKSDPSGYETLIKVLKEKDMAAFKIRWERYILDLRFP